MKNEQILPVYGDVLIVEKAISSNFIFINSLDEIDFIKSNLYKVLLKSNQSFPIPVEFTPGIEYKIFLVQDNVGGRILTFNFDYFVFLNNDSGTINTEPNSVSLLILKYDGDKFYCEIISSVIRDGEFNNLLANTAKIGTSSNYSEFEADGMLKFNGNSTVWMDLMPNAVTVATGSSAPSISIYNGANLRAYEFLGSATKKDLNMMFQMPHSYKEDSSINLHLHLYIPDNVAGGTIKFTCNYTWTNVNQLGAVVETVINSTLVRTANQGIDNNAIISFPDIVGTGKKISSILSCSISRDPSDVQDTFGTSVWLKAADVHVEMDTVGSRLPLSK